jgi:formate dehydrogenase subunit gamma
MMTSSRRAAWRAILASILLVVIALTWAADASAQQPPASAPATAEDQALQQLRQVQGRITIPDTRASVLIQPAGRDWREFHESALPWVGGVAILGMLGLIVVFYAVRGTIRIEGGRSGIRILRFSAFERFNHWMTAGCFIVLALSGLNITFGKALILPLTGAEGFSALSQYCKFAHNYLAFPFMLGLLFTLVVWIKDNIPDKVDVAWFKAGGGIFKKGHPPSRKFNGGQKLIYWAVIIGGLALSLTGLILLFPFSGTTIADMQLAQMLHAIVAVLLIAVMIAHIYIGSLGMEGAFDAMETGEVDLNWAREHHSLWVQDEAARGRVAGGEKGAVPAE